MGRRRRRRESSSRSSKFDHRHNIKRKCPATVTVGLRDEGGSFPRSSTHSHGIGRDKEMMEREMVE